MLQRSILTFLLAVSIAAFAACSSSTPTMNSSPTTLTPAQAAKANDVVSETTRMVCSDEAEEDIAIALGVETTQSLAPTWRNHQYACIYRYKTGSMRLAVQQLPDAKSTDRYFDALVTGLGRAGRLEGLGQGAFTTKQNSVVVRKDNKVLIVDVAGLPARFGVPPDVRANVAVTVAATIMGCWKGE